MLIVYTYKLTYLTPLPAFLIPHYRRKENFTIVPILVGSLSDSNQIAVAKVLSPYLADEDNLFVISSDFCHWGSSLPFTAVLKLLCTSAVNFHDVTRSLSHKYRGHNPSIP